MRDRIVVGMDGSPAAQAALAWAVCLGEALGTEVVAVHAVDVLLDAAAREHAALVVVGAGSTSLRLLQGARVPTLVVPDTCESGTAVDRLRRRILVGVDRSPPSLAALAVAVDIARILSASLTVVEAFEFQPPFPLAVPDAGTRRADLLPTAAVVEDLVPRIREDGIAVEVVIRSGEPAATLLQVADDIDADLLVVGSRGGGDPADPLLGSVARSVAGRGRRPTLVVPAAAGSVHLTAETEDHTPIA